MYVYFFFFKQKTAYEMRISDWNSDVCSSDLFSSILVPGAVAPDGPITVAGQRDWWLGQLAGRFVAALFCNDQLPNSSAVQELVRSEEHTSELQSLMRISYAVFCLKKKTKRQTLNECKPKKKTHKHTDQ